jgi:H+/Cl- antiporter ClcA
MQTATASKHSDDFKSLFISVCLGLVVGALTTTFLKLLFLIEAQHEVWNVEAWPWHVLLIPLAYVILYLLKKRTLYFPSKISELMGWKSDSCLHWSVWMAPFQFIGTLLSHLVGASVGRESVVVLMSAGLIRAFQLSWAFWGPIAMGCGFAAVLGNPFIGLIFMGELWTTNFRQKLFVVVSSCFACVLMETLGVRHLLLPLDLTVDVSFGSKLIFILSLAVSVGFIMRFYKWAFLKCSSFFSHRSLVVKLGFSLILMGLLWIPELRRFQSLGVLQIEDINHLALGFQVPFLKLGLTMFSVTLGFWGGEFIPLVYTGVHFGATMAQSFGWPSILGAYLSAYLFFAGASRLKWTSFFLALSLLGFSWVIWLLILVTLTVGFSGEKSLYQPHE